MGHLSHYVFILMELSLFKLNFSLKTKHQPENPTGYFELLQIRKTIGNNIAAHTVNNKLWILKFWTLWLEDRNALYKKKYDTGNYIQYPVIIHNGKEYEKDCM